VEGIKTVKTTRIWLIRHGEPVKEARQRCYGSLDVGLSEHGRRQIAAVATRLARESLSAIYASPFSRALESARILAATTQTKPQIADGFKEINFGDFEGKTYDDIAARHPELYRQWMATPTKIRFPNGESFSDMQARVLRAFDAVRQAHEGETVAIVSHGGVNRIVIAHALQVPEECLFRIHQDHAAMNLLAFTEGIPVLQKLNQQATQLE
jgi:alpha-ribazole phosphatase